MVASVQGEDETESESTVAVVAARNSLAAAVERPTARRERLESECAPQQPPTSTTGATQPLASGVREMGLPKGRSQFRGKCWQCGTPGNLARDCPQNGHLSENSYSQRVWPDTRGQ